MGIFTRSVSIYTIPVELPLRRIYARLGFRKATTQVDDAEEAKIRRILDEGLISCHLSGVYARRRIAHRDAEQIVLEDGISWESRNLAAFLADAAEVMLLGATAGHEIVALRDQALEQGQTFKAVILDAFASEMAESATQWLHDYVGKTLRKEVKAVTTRRYSPGYGDFSLHHQQEIVSLLQFEELGVRVNEHSLLIPEKSVTAVVGILSS